LLPTNKVYSILSEVKNSKIQRSLRAILKVARIGKFYLAALVATFLIVELGLRLSHVLQPSAVPKVERAEDSAHRILLVSDSILGTMGDNREAAGKFVLKMNELYPDKAFVTEIFRGGLLTSEVEKQLEEKVLADRISTVIFMIGKSDWVRGWVDRTFGQLAQSWVASLEASKLFMVLMVDLQRQFTLMWPDRLAIAEHGALVAPWKLYSTQDIRGIEAFESVMLTYPNDIRAIRALVHLYHVHSKVPEGIQFLEKLAEVSDEADFVRLQIANLKFDLERRNTGQVPDQTVSEWDQAISSLPNQRLAFLARMRYFLNTGAASDFESHLRSMSYEQSDVLLPSTYATMARIIEKAVSMRLRVILLEYPSDHSLPLRRVMEKYASQIEIYDTRNWLLDSIERDKVIGAFKVDIEHLTPFGAEHFAENMVRIYRQGPAEQSASKE
jgi:hypothetical protein